MSQIIIKYKHRFITSNMKSHEVQNILIFSNIHTTQTRHEKKGINSLQNDRRGLLAMFTLHHHT